MASKAAVGRVLAGLWLRYPAQQLDDDTRALTIGAWLEDCADVPDELLVAAAKAYQQSAEKWMPPPGVIRDMALKLSGGDADARALTAWETILDSDFGRDLDGVDETARKVMRLLGGFEAYGNGKLEDEHYFRDRFIKLYSSLAERQDGRALIGVGATLRLVGKRT